MYIVKLTKVHSDHDEGLRTNDVDGSCESLPVVGQNFSMTSKPLDENIKGFRLIETSIVQSIGNLSSSLMVFKTTYSTYKLEFHESA